MYYAGPESLANNDTTMYYADLGVLRIVAKQHTVLPWGSDE